MITFLIIGVVPVGVSLTSYFFATRHALEDSAKINLENLAEWESKLIKDWSGQQMNTVRMMANSRELRARDWEKINIILQHTKQHFPQFAAFVFIDTTGTVIYETEGNKGIKVSDREYFKAGMRGEEYISELLVARTFKRPCIVFSVPVRDGGKIVGLLSGAVTVDALGEVMSYSTGETGESFLIDRNGNLITIPKSLRKAGVDDDQLIPAPKNYLTKDLKESNRVIYHKDERNEDVITVTKWLPELKVLLVTKQGRSEALEDTGGWGLYLGVMTGNGLLLLTIPIILIIARKISHPLTAITTSVNEIASGKLSHRIAYIKANKEIELLAEQINDMAAKMEESMKVIGEQLTEMESQKEEIIAQNDDILLAYDQLSKANESLQQLATTDQLTEICNRRYFMDRLRREILVSLRSSRPFSVMLIDIDHFKAVNDTYGHKSGDQVLKGLVQVISENIRKSDLLARFGGEEFIVLAPETNLEGGMVLAEKIRAAVEVHEFKIDDGELKITISIGLTELHDFTGTPEKTEDNLILAADHYLYEAKRNGRNRVEGGIVTDTAN